MRFNPIAFLVLVAFFGLLAFGLSSRSSNLHIAEAIVTVLIAIGIGGFALRGGQQSRTALGGFPHVPWCPPSAGWCRGSYARRTRRRSRCRWSPRTGTVTFGLPATSAGGSGYSTSKKRDSPFGSSVWLATC